MNASYKISQVTQLTESMMLDCYYIVSQSWPNEADGVFYSLKNKLNNPGLVMFVASDKTDVVRGFIVGHVSDKVYNAKIDWLFVEGRHGRRGIGKMLVQYCADYCRSRGISQLDVQPARTVQARQFYAKQGFVQTSSGILWNKNLGR